MYEFSMANSTLTKGKDMNNANESNRPNQGEEPPKGAANPIETELENVATLRKEFSKVSKKGKWFVQISFYVFSYLLIWSTLGQLQLIWWALLSPLIVLVILAFRFALFAPQKMERSLSGDYKIWKVWRNILGSQVLYIVAAIGFSLLSNNMGLKAIIQFVSLCWAIKYAAHDLKGSNVRVRERLRLMEENLRYRQLVHGLVQVIQNPSLVDDKEIIVVPVSGDSFDLLRANIAYTKGSGNKGVEFYLVAPTSSRDGKEQEKLIVSSSPKFDTMKLLEEALGSRFVQVNRSHFVNMASIDHFDEKKEKAVLLIGGSTERIRVSKTYLQGFKSIYGEYSRMYKGLRRMKARA